MRPDQEHAVDWRDGAAYEPLLEADRSIFAWEWLRRDPDYRAAAKARVASAEPSNARRPELWGLHAFENPELAAPCARPVWCAEFYPHVLKAVAAGPGVPSDTFDLARFAPLATIVGAAEEREHLLLSDGFHAVRIDVVAGSLTHGPVQLRYLLTGFASAERPLLTLRRLLALEQTGRFSRTLHARDARARRWLLALRAHDALAAGADQREIAAVLLSLAAGEPRWRSRASSVRSQAQRLVRSARRASTGGYVGLLR